jgi:hypothetical protein
VDEIGGHVISSLIENLSLIETMGPCGRRIDNRNIFNRWHHKPRDSCIMKSRSAVLVFMRTDIAKIRGKFLQLLVANSPKNSSSFYKRSISAWLLLSLFAC